MKELIYEGKAKKIFKTSNEDELIFEFKNSLTAFNGVKKGNFLEKGLLCRNISDILFRYLSKNSVTNHWIQLLSEQEVLVTKTKMVPLEVVIRRVAAGSLVKKLGFKEGAVIEPPITEYYLKDDGLGDPLLNEDHILALNLSNPQQLVALKSGSLKVFGLLKSVFSQVGIDLIDLKLEWGVNSKGELILADELSPDNMRLWDSETKQKLDKDRFRQDLGDIDKTYVIIFERLKALKI